MFTHIEDIDNIMLLSLSWDDLQHYCSTDHLTLSKCKTNKVLQNRINTIRIKVDKITNAAPVFDFGIILQPSSLSLKFQPFHRLGEKYNLTYNFNGLNEKILYKLFVVELRVQYVKRTNYYEIVFTVAEKRNDEPEDNYNIWVEGSEQQIKKFLFHAYYDNIILTF